MIRLETSKHQEKVGIVVVGQALQQQKDHALPQQPARGFTGTLYLALLPTSFSSFAEMLPSSPLQALILTLSSKLIISRVLVIF